MKKVMLLSIITSAMLLNGCGEKDNPEPQIPTNCPTGFVGDNCDQCAPGYEGEKCTKIFTCINGENNDQGGCDCINGFAGAHCNICDDGFYGKECSKCPDCGTHGKCDDGIIGNGSCKCKKGWEGANCQTESPKQPSCPDGFTGDNCDECADSRFTGKNCDQCANSLFTGENCDECADSRFTGENCEFCIDGSTDAEIFLDYTYKTICINGKFWMSENLRNPEKYHYSANGDSNNDSRYGYLYSWKNAMAACPSGWRLPSSSEFLALIDASEYNSSIENTAIQDTSWASSGTNSTGFSALPAGYRASNDTYPFFSKEAFFWSSTRCDTDKAYNLAMDTSLAIVKTRKYNLFEYSVRCLKDICEEGHTGPNCQKITCVNGVLNTEDGTCLDDSCQEGYTGKNCDQCADSRFIGENCDECADSRFTGDNCETCIDGSTDAVTFLDYTYKAVCINSQFWMAENLRSLSRDHYSVDGNSDNDSTYGYLYTWVNAKNACPTGWRLPYDHEFLDLIGTTKYNFHVSINTTAIQDASWVSNAVNSTGFNAIPAGYRNDDGSFDGFNSYAAFWGDYAYKGYAYHLEVNSDNASVYANKTDNAYSVRCVKK